MSLRAYIAGVVLAVAVSSAHAAPIAYAESDGSFAGNTQSVLYSIDLSTRVATLVGPAVPGAGGLVNGLYPFNIRGLSFDPTGQLYAVSEDLRVLVKLNRGTGAATVVGPLNLAGPGLAGDLSLSMAITCDGKAWLASGTGNFWSVNLASGATTLIGALGNNPITGLAAQGTSVFATGSQTNQKLYSVNTATGAATLLGAYGGTDGSAYWISPAFDATGQLWAILNNAPAAAESWSNLASIAAGGALGRIGPVTGPAALQGVGLKGMAIAPPVCTAPVDPPATPAAPTLSGKALAGLIALMIGCAFLPLARRRARR